MGYDFTNDKDFKDLLEKAQNERNELNDAVNQGDISEILKKIRTTTDAWTKASEYLNNNLSWKENECDTVYDGQLNILNNVGSSIKQAIDKVHKK